jgi:hypothetical protein
MVKMLPFFGVAFAAGLAGAFSSLSAQEDIATQFHNCTGVQKDVDRLMCYDTAFSA